MRLLNYSLIDIADNTNKNGIFLEKQGSEYERTSQYGIVSTAQSGGFAKEGDKVWFFHKACDNKTDFFGKLQYAVLSDFIYAKEIDGTLLPNNRIIASKVEKQSNTSLSVNKTEIHKHLFLVESAPKGSEFKSGNYIIPRKNSAYYIDECDRFFIDETRIVCTAIPTKTEGEYVNEISVDKLFNEHHLVNYISDEEYEKIGSIYMKRKEIYQMGWANVIKSDRFEDGETVFSAKSVGGEIEINGKSVIALKSKQIFFAT